MWTICETICYLCLFLVTPKVTFVAAVFFFMCVTGSQQMYFARAHMASHVEGHGRLHAWPYGRPHGRSWPAKYRLYRLSVNR